MAKKISELPAASSLAGTEEVEVNQGGISKKATASQIYAAGTAKRRKVASGKYFCPIRPYSDQAGGAIPANNMRLWPFEIDEPVTFNEIMVRISTAAAGGNVQAAVYASDANGNPTGNPLASTPNISTGTVGPGIGVLGASVTLQPGMYWMATNGDAASATAVMRAPGTNTMLALFGSTSPANIASAAPPTSLSKPATFGTWPDMTGNSYIENTGTGYAVAFLRMS